MSCLLVFQSLFCPAGTARSYADEAAADSIVVVAEADAGPGAGELAPVGEQTPAADETPVVDEDPAPDTPATDDGQGSGDEPAAEGDQPADGIDSAGDLATDEAATETPASDTDTDANGQKTAEQKAAEEAEKAAAEEAIAVAAIATMGLDEPTAIDEAPVDIDSSVASGSLTLMVNGVEIGTDTVVDRDATVNGTLSLAFNPNAQPSAAHPNYVYSFPSGVTVSNTAAGQALVDASNSIAGTWHISNNQIVINYDTDWLATHSSDIAAAFKFDFKMNAGAIGDNNQATYSFPCVVTPITIHTGGGKVTGSKSAKVNADGTITFSVPLNATATVSDFSFTDTMGSSLVFDASSFQFDGSPITVTVSGQTATYSQSTLAAGSHTLTYNATVSPEALAAFANGQLPNTGNQVDWAWNGGTGSASAWPSLSRNAIAKSAGQLSNDGTSVKWTATLNQGNLPAVMDGYVFTDTLPNGMTFNGSDYTVKDASGSVVATGATVDGATSFTYTFTGATAQKYTIEYFSTAPAAVGTYKNTATVTPPGKDPISATGTYTNKGVGTDFIDKSVVSNDANATGAVSWSTVIHAGSIINKTGVSYTDYFDWNRHVWFDGEPVVTYSGGTLVAGTDYTLSWDRDFGDGKKGQFTINFNKNTDAAVAALAGDITVTYSSMCDKTAGTFVNTANLSHDGITSSDTADFIVEASGSSTKAGTASWDATFDNGDGTNGAWIATWTVVANPNTVQSWQPYGDIDLQGKDVTVVDTMGEGMAYIAGSATYEAQTDYGKKVNGSVDPVVAGSTFTFTVPTSGVTKDDGTCKAKVTLTYKTKLDSSKIAVGSSQTYSNSVAVNADGSIPLGGDTGEVTVANEAISKSSMSISSTSLLRYTIGVNDKAQDLSTTDTLTVVDVLDYQTTLVNSSFKVTNAAGDNISAQCSITPTDVVDGLGHPTTQLSIVVPDATSLTITYNVALNGTLGSWTTVSNTASLMGFDGAMVVDTGSYQVQSSSGSTTGGSSGVQIIKSDKDSITTTLEGAEFELYSVNLADWAADADVETAATLVSRVTTNATGIATFSKEDLGTGRALQNNTLYYFVESQAPSVTQDDGSVVDYTLNTTKYFFMFEGSDTAGYQAQLALAADHSVIPSTNINYNVYDEKVTKTPATAVVMGSKLMDGELPADGAFQFAFKDAAGVVVQTVSNDGSGAISFDQLSFSEAGTFTYAVCEVIPEGATDNGDGTFTLDDVVYDGHEVTVTITVTENAAGTGYDAAVSYSDEGGLANFKNVSAAKRPAATTATIEGSKTLVGRDWKEGEAYSFALIGLDGAPVPEGDGATATVTENGAFAFGEIAFDAAGTYSYQVTEVGGGTTVDGVAMDGRTATATVTVTEIDGNRLSAAVTYGEDNAAPDFTNTYSTTSCSATLEGSKTLTGRDWNEGEAFTFTLAGLDGAPMPAGDGATATVTGADGDFAFGEIAFDAAGTYSYQVTEVGGGATVEGTALDGRVATATVTVADDGAGSLSCDVAYGTGAAAPDFVNVYAASPAKATIGGTKTLAGRDWKEGEAYSFALTGLDGAPVPEGAGATATATENGAFVFGEIGYAAPGIYNYQITEVGGGTTVDGVALDGRTATAVVTVTDNGDGTMSCDVAYGTGAAAPDFVNAYDATGAFMLQAQKTLDGEAPAEAAFGFTAHIVADDESFDTTLVASNAADGSVSFAGVNLAFGGPASYTFTIFENIPEGAVYDAATNTASLGGITYACAVVNGTVTVVDNLDGTLGAVIMYDGSSEEPVFANTTYTIKVSVSKVAVAGGPEVPGCRLQVTDAGGAVVDEWVSGEQPHVVEGLAAGATYTLTETRPADGYATAEPVEFAVADTGEVQAVEMVDEQTEVSINKVADDSWASLAGAVLQVLDSNGSVVEQWTTDESAHLIQGILIEGATYTLHEVSAPEGYSLAEDVQFSVPMGPNALELTMIDGKVYRKTTPISPKIPKTGDDGPGNAGVLAGFGAASVLLAGGIFVLRRRGDYEGQHFSH